MKVFRDVRSYLRPVLGATTLWRVASSAVTAVVAVKNEGIGTYLALRRLERAPAHGPAVPVILSNLREPIYLRPGSEDVRTVINNVIREEWGKLPRSVQPAVVVDAGAYIGDTAAYFATRFPTARVLALEPHPVSGEMARRNLSLYGDQVTFAGLALWSKNGVVEFGGVETRAGVGLGNLSVRAVSVDGLLTEFGLESIDLLKMDVEGAEVEIFKSPNLAWLNAVERILLEVHGEGAECTCLSVLSAAGFRQRRYRNVWYCQR